MASAKNKPSDLTPSAENSNLMVYNGPLPDPVTFRRYNDALPDAAERIMAIYEDEVKHRHKVEMEQLAAYNRKISIDEKYVDSETRNSLLGMVFAFLLSLVVIIGGMYMIIATEHSITGTLFSGAGLASIVGAFIYGARGKEISTDEKNRK